MITKSLSLLFLTVSMASAASTAMIATGGGTDFNHVTCAYSSANTILIGYSDASTLLTRSHLTEFSSDLETQNFNQQVYLNPASLGQIYTTVHGLDSGKIILGLQTPLEAKMSRYSSDGTFEVEEDQITSADPLNIQGLNGALLSNGNVLFAVGVSDELQTSVRNSALSAVASPTAISAEVPKTAITSYPASLGYHAMALEVTTGTNITLYIRNSNGVTVGEHIIEDSGDTVSDPSVAALASNDIVICYKKVVGPLTQAIYQFFYPGNDTLSAATVAVEDASLNTVDCSSTLSDGGFAMLYGIGSNSYFQRFDSVGESFGPAINFNTQTLSSLDYCSSASTPKFSAVYSYGSPATYKVAQFPKDSAAVLNIVKNCNPNTLTFNIGGGNINILVAREIVDEDDYRVIDLVFSGIGTAEVTLVEANFPNANVEFTYFEDNGSGAISVATFDFPNHSFRTNIVDNSCGCVSDFFVNEEEDVCAQVDSFGDPSLLVEVDVEDAIQVDLNLDLIETTYFVGDTVWSVLSTNLQDLAVLEQLLGTVGGLLSISIPREYLLNGGEYAITAVTENGRTAETAFIYQDNQIVDAIVNDQGQIVPVVEDIIPPVEEDVIPPVEEDVIPPIEEDIIPPVEEDILPPIEEDIIPPVEEDSLPIIGEEEDIIDEEDEILDGNNSDQDEVDNQGQDEQNADDTNEEEDEQEDGENNDDDPLEEEDDTFIDLEEELNYNTAYRFTDRDGNPVTDFADADKIQLRLIFPAEDAMAQQCFAYGEVENDIQNFECYGVRKGEADFEPIVLQCPRNVRTGESMCEVRDDIELELVSNTPRDSLNKRLLAESLFVAVIVQRDINDFSSNIPQIFENSSHDAFSFVNNFYSLNLENVSGSAPRKVTFVVVEEKTEEEESSYFNYDFTKSLAPFILLIVGLIWILVNAILFHRLRGFKRYSKTEHFNRESSLSTFWAMLLTGHAFGTVYAYRSPTTSKLQRSVLYFGRAVGLMLFVNVYHMEKFGTERFLSETESKFQWELFVLPYMTVLPIVWFVSVLLRGRCNYREESSKVVKIFGLFTAFILIFLSLVFTIVIQSKMEEDQRDESNIMFGWSIVQDFFVTPFLTLLLQRILYCIFYKERNDKLVASNFGYIAVNESFRDCMFDEIRIVTQPDEVIVTDEGQEIDLKENAKQMSD